MEKVKLNPEAARQDLTIRECTKLIGGSLGGLCGMADKEVIAQAIEWWAENFRDSGLHEITRRFS